MQATLSMAEVSASQKALDELAAKELPVSLSLAVARARRKVREHYTDYIEAYNALVHRYSEDGQQVKPDNAQPFMAEKRELDAQEVKVEVEALDPAMLVDRDGNELEIAAWVLDALAWMLSE